MITGKLDSETYYFAMNFAVKSAESIQPELGRGMVPRPGSSVTLIIS